MFVSPIQYESRHVCPLSHASHQLLAIYHLGANGALIEAAYQKQTQNQRDAFKSPATVNEENFHEHLGDEE